MEKGEEGAPLVLDNGGYRVRLGWGGAEAPVSTTEPVVGYPFARGVMVGVGDKDRYVGAEALSKWGYVALRFPIRNRVVAGWTWMEDIWRHLLHDMEPEVHPIMVAETWIAPAVARATTMAILFENFNVPAMYLANQQVLAAVGAGRPTALVVDIGNDDTHIIPVVQGEVHDNGAMQLTGLGGANLTKYLATLLQKNAPKTRGLDNHDSLLRAAALGYCSPNLELDRRLAAMPQASLPFYDAMQMKGTYLDLLPGELLAAVHHSVHYHSIARWYQAPDGSIVEVGSERFECAEALFHPQPLCALDKHCSPKGIHYAVADTINSLDSIGRDIQLPDLAMVVVSLTVNAGLMSELSRNILLIGATARLSGLSARLQHEVGKLITTAGLAVQVSVPSNPELAPWIGGSKVSCAPGMIDHWIHKEAYDECGPQLLSERLETDEPWFADVASRS